MFSVEAFVEDCRAALGADPSHWTVREVVARAVAEPGQVLKGLGEPQKSQMQVLHRAADLTVLNVVWGPMMTLLPHNHRMWAVIGIYTGREDNIFWRSVPGNRIEAAGAKNLGAGDAVPLGAEIIHSVTNPIPRLTGAIHVYGGDFFAPGRSEWDPETLDEGPLDPQRTLARFEAANAAAGV